ncbi:hypothetical protein MMC29_004173, partial [Sticta canariensis]|nr:hypothetical protein [Sticta canariensis]
FQAYLYLVIMNPIAFCVPCDELAADALAEILSEICGNEKVHDNNTTPSEQVHDNDVPNEKVHDDNIPEIPMAEQLEYALCAYHKAFEDYETQPKSSTQKNRINRPIYARLYHVDHTTLRRRYKNETEKAQYTNERRQRFTPAEEISIVDWILQLEAWNFPPMVSRVRELAEGILRKREDLEPLEIHWPTKFLARHKQITSQ